MQRNLSSALARLICLLFLSSIGPLPALAQSPGTNWVEKSGCYIIQMDTDPRIQEAEEFLTEIQFELEKLALSATRKVVEKLAGVPRFLSVGVSVFLGIIFNAQLVGGGIPDYSHGEVVAIINEGRAANANAEAQTEYAVVCFLEVGAQVDVPRHVVLEKKTGLFSWAEIARWELLTTNEAESLSPFSNPLGNKYLLVSKELIQFPDLGTYRLSYSTGRTIKVGPKTSFTTVSADLSTVTVRGNGMTVQTSGMDFNSSGACWRMPTPGTSYFEASFNVAQVPTSAVLSLTHLSSASSMARGGGYSPVDIYVNGQLFRDNFDVAENHCGSHGYEFDEWDISARLTSGLNTIRIESEDNPRAETHYWIQAAQVSAGALPIEPAIRSFRPSPSTVTRGDGFQLIAGCVRSNPNTTVSTVEFWRDADGSGLLDTGSDQFIGTGSNSGGDWIWLGNADFPFGSQRFFCRASDSAGNWSAPESTLCNVVAAPAPVLSSQSLSPGSGTTSQTFTYQVSYLDSSGAPPLNAKVYIDGLPFTMTRVSGTGANGTYRYAKGNFSTGTHNYQFVFRSGSGVDVSLPQTGTFSGPTVSSTGGTQGTIAISVYWGASGEPDTVQGHGGTVEPRLTPDQKFSAGDQVWFTAYPDFGWTVDSWLMWWDFSGGTRWAPVDGVIGNSAFIYVREPLGVQPGVRKENAVRCVFRRLDPNQRVLKISSVGPGQVSPNPGNYPTNFGASVTLSATPNPTSQFVGWVLDGANAGSNPTISVTMDGVFDKEIKATFSFTNLMEFTADLPCTDDSTIQVSLPDENNPTHPRISVRHRANLSRQEAILKFDISRLPSDATVIGAVLHIWCDSAPNDAPALEVQRNLSDWSEATIVGSNPPITSTNWPNGLI